MISFSIQPLTVNDLSFLKEVRDQSVNFLHDSKVFTLEETIHWYKNEKPLFYLIKKENEKIGYFRTSNWEEDTLYIGCDFHQDFRGFGYAYIVYLMFLNWLSEKGYKHIYLKVLAKNVRAFNLYKKLGFQIIDEQEIERNGEKELSWKMYKMN